MAIIMRTVLYSYTKLDMIITWTCRDKYRLTLIMWLKISTKFVTTHIGMHSIELDLKITVICFFSQKMIQANTPRLLTMHGRKFYIISYVNYSLVPAIGPQYHHMSSRYQFEVVM
jgi:hypothetical protein